MDGIIVIEGKKKKKEKQICLMCKIPIIFSDFEHDLDKNISDVAFLNGYHAKLYFHLNKLFNAKKDCIFCFLRQECEHKGRDWYSRGTWKVPVSDSIWYSKKMKMNQMEKRTYWTFSSSEGNK